MKLRDRVTVITGHYAGRQGEVIAIDQFGVGVHLDHMAETRCDCPVFRYPDTELVTQ